MSEKMNNILKSDCAHTVEDILNVKAKGDYKALMEMVSSANKKDLQLSKAIYVLGRWKNKEAVGPIVKAIPFLDEVGKSTAIDALSLLGGEDSLNAIVDLAKDKSPMVRKFVGIKLSRFKEGKAMECLKEISSKDEVEFVRVAALRSMG